MAGFSNYSENLVLTWLLTASTATRPSGRYVALYTVAPGEGSAGTEVSTSGTAYVRQSATFTVSGDSPTEAENSVAIEFPTATASWGTIVAASVMDAETGGNILAFANLGTSKAIDTGDVLRFNVGALTVTLD
jgi:hypothetical protein